MVIHNCFTPPQGDAPAHNKGDDLRKAIEAVLANVGQIIEKLSTKDETPPEPSGMVTVTKMVTTYEFDAEGVGKALVKTVGAIMRGFKWEPSGLPEANVGMPVRPEDGGIPVDEIPPEAAQVFAAAFSNLDTLEGPDGKLKPEFVEVIVSTLVASRPSKEAALGLAADMIQALAPEKHREQLMNEITKLSVRDRISRYEAATRAVREASEPIVTPPPAGTTPDASKQSPAAKP